MVFWVAKSFSNNDALEIGAHLDSIQAPSAPSEMKKDPKKHKQHACPLAEQMKSSLFCHRLWAVQIFRIFSN